MKKIYLLLLFSLTACLVAFSQNPRTLTYYKDDSTHLEMDVFQPEAPATEKLPLLIYVHGGGFASGERKAGYPVCGYLAKKGIVAATITYSLYMKGKKDGFGCEGSVSEKVKAMQYAANQLWQATAYFIEHSKELNIDTTKIFIAGSSAGAETVLHAQYWNYTNMNRYKKQLPKDFRYAGLIAGAGAIMDLNLIRQDNLVPMMMFHGSCDRLVPYETAAHHYCEPTAKGWLMFFGSYSIYRHVTEMGGRAKLYTFCGGGHEHSNTLFTDKLELVYTFLNQVLNKEKFQEHVAFPTDKGCEHNQKYPFCK